MTATIITPPRTTTRTYENYSGEQITKTTTEWTCGAYTLQKIEEPGYSHWTVRTADRDLPEIYEMGSYGAETVEFGVNWSGCGTQTAAEAATYAQQIATAAATAAAFTAIIAAETN